MIEYTQEIEPLTDELRKRAGELADFLVTQPPRRLALQATREFGWWCVQEGATHAHVVTERIRRHELARQRDGAQQRGDGHAQDL